jgi:hypothetical protein
VSFDFSGEVISPNVITEAVVTVSQYRGNVLDENVASVLSGTPVISGGIVLHLVAAGIRDTDYLLTASVTLTDGQVREIPAVLLVRVDNE